MSLIASRSCIVALLLLMVPRASAQGHFEECASGTGNNATIVIGAATPVLLNGFPLQLGDEIAVMTPSGACAGVLVWAGEGSQAFTVWADDPISTGIDGFAEGEEMYYRVWSEDLGAEVGGSSGTVSVEYETCETHSPLCSPAGDYQGGAIFYVDRIEAYTMATDVSLPPSAEGRISVYPNPFSRRATAEVLVPYSDYVTVEMIDTLGRTVSQLYTGWMEAGQTYRIPLEGEALALGTHFVRVQSVASHTRFHSCISDDLARMPTSELTLVKRLFVLGLRLAPRLRVQHTSPVRSVMLDPPDGIPDQFGHAADVELRLDARAVRVHGLSGEGEPLCDLLPTHPEPHHLEHLGFTLAQNVHRMPFVASSARDLAEYPFRRVFRDNDLAIRQGSDGR